MLYARLIAFFRRRQGEMDNGLKAPNKHIVYIQALIGG